MAFPFPYGEIRPDLHVHTNASDGELSPAQVLEVAAQRNVNLLAITDHDTLSGLDAAQAGPIPAGMHLLPGVEVSAGGETEVHILGYGVHSGMKRLVQMLSDMRLEREERAERMVARLSRLGLPIALTDVASPQAQSLGRAHIGRALMKKGLVDSLPEAFEKYLSPGRPGYEPRRRLKVSQVVQLLREEGAVPVIAHPGLMKMEHADFSCLLTEWKDAGLMGLEVYHPAHPPASLKSWEDLAHRHGLLVTGGSDFHGADGRHPDIGAMLPLWPEAFRDAQELLSALDALRAEAQGDDKSGAGLKRSASASIEPLLYPR